MFLQKRQLFDIGVGNKIMQLFKVGDTVRFRNRSTVPNGYWQNHHDAGGAFAVKCVSADGLKCYLFNNDDPYSPGGDGCPCRKHNWCERDDDVEIIKSSVNSNAMTSLKEKFALAFKGEPEKSFIKAGVMNSDESLTTDGKEVFLAYLLKKNGDDFKTTVIDPILAAEAADAK